MSDQVAQQLKQLISQYGWQLANEPSRVNALLRDLCPQHKREVHVLSAVAKEGLTQVLLQDGEKISATILLPRLAERLYDELGTDQALAIWAVTAWATALGLKVAPVQVTAPSMVRQEPSPIKQRSPHQSKAPAIGQAIPSIHGWSSAQVRQLQQDTARALQRDPIFHDRLTDGSTGPELVIIPAGRFLMGSPEDEEERVHHERQHEVVIALPFALGQYPVTFDEYDRFCKATGRNQPGDQGWGRERRPVINVDWHDALAYCAWLSQQTGQTYRLPTEAEWEYACRAGTTTPFYFGATINTDQANYYGHSIYGSGRKGEYREQTTPVGEFPANAWRLHDMHGNVWEWTGSVYDEHYGGAEQRSASADESGGRVVRGGSWLFGPPRLRSAYRLRATPVGRDIEQGFRLARSF